MDERTMAIVVSLCKHCGQIIDNQVEDLAVGEHWEEPKIGGMIGLDIITKVDEAKFPKHPNFRGYVIELDTRRRPVPHCEEAKEKINPT